jgi:hypothetical protein
VVGEVLAELVGVRGGAEDEAADEDNATPIYTALLTHYLGMHIAAANLFCLHPVLNYNTKHCIGAHYRTADEKQQRSSAGKFETLI